jgi:predicted metal-dependent peptidase
MTKEETLAKASKDLMWKEPFYGFFLIMLNKIWTNKVPTAGVCKYNINYQLAINEKFWIGLSENHKVGLLKHELLHIAYFHLTQYFNFPDRKLANIAMDMEINQYIETGYLPGDEYSKDEFEQLKQSIKTKVTTDLEAGTITQEQAIEELGKLPMRGIMIDDYDELNLDRKAGCRYYYQMLKEAKDKKEEQGTSGSPNFDQLCDQMDGDGEGLPDHSTWEDFEDLSDAEQKLIQNQMERLLTDAAEQTVKKRGTVPGNVEQFLEKMKIKVAPKFNWRGYMRRFTGVSSKVFTKKIRRKENRRYSENPGLKVKMRQHMLLAIDTSGSVSNTELIEFMSEIEHIHKCGVDITVVQCDTSIRSIEPFKVKDDFKVHGRGGTEFDPVLEYYNENLRKYTSLVYFTDGECTADVKPKAPVLWVLSERSSMNDSLPGKIIKLEI